MFEPMKLPGCSSGVCSTSFPKFPGVPNLEASPKLPKYSTIQEDRLVPAEEWKDPVQWRSEDRTVVIEGYSGLGAIDGENYYFRNNPNNGGSVIIEKISGYEKV